ncbi:alpha-aminoadipic semialdehyde synthase-like [Bidens hawaiensis]|uniref:alpha-aminoadipic semialdehyde synthase-like n=1 Tax=Bidens hawaiensis TaxID=980011 RepID=UPI00404B9ECE
MLGNGVIGILSETTNKWERRAPLTPAHCARLLHSGKLGKEEVRRIIVQPSTKRIHHDDLYEDVGCEVSQDLSDCGLILGIKQPKLEMILPDRAYAFFSHTNKAQKENMPLLDKILAERASLYDYELIVGDEGKRLLAFGKFAGRAGLVDFLSGLGRRYLSLGYSTPFLSLGSSYMYPSLAAAKAAVVSVGEEIATTGLPSSICPLVFVFTGSGNVSLGAQEIFKLLPHTFVDSSRLPELFDTASQSKRAFQVYGCVVSYEDMVEHSDPVEVFNKVDYYAHPERYKPIFHKKVAPYASVIVNCMYWERRYPRLLSYRQLQDLVHGGCPLVGICDITCDIGGSIEFVNRTTLIDSPFFRYDPFGDSYHEDIEGDGIICLAVDILPTEFAKEASQHFGDVLSNFIGNLASTKDIEDLPLHLRRACIAHGGALTHLYEYIPRMRNSQEVPENVTNGLSNKKRYTISVSISGHLFDQFLINEALDIIEAAGGSFHLVKCQVGQCTDSLSYSELEVGAYDSAVLDKIVDTLTSVANPKEDDKGKTNLFALKVGEVKDTSVSMGYGSKKRNTVLILGAGRVCQPAVEFLASIGSNSPSEWKKSCKIAAEFEEHNYVQVVVASLFLKDAEETIEGIPDAIAVELDVMDHDSLYKYTSQVDVVVSLLPPTFHCTIANVCIELKKHLVTASYINDSMFKLHDAAKDCGITILGEMGLDPGIDHMMAMKMINQAHAQGGKIKSFVSNCGGIPSPAAANNPLAYKFSWNPAGAIRAGRNPATYRLDGQTVHVDGGDIYKSATKFRLHDIPAFALEVLPNRDSLIYGDLYGVAKEALTIFRGTLRYEGFGEIMGSLARIGFFNSEVHPILTNKDRPATYRTFLFELLEVNNSDESVKAEKVITERLLARGICKEDEAAVRTAKAIIFLGFYEQTEIPSSCQTAFDVTCLRMEERLAYTSMEQDMVLLHHEIVVEFSNGRPTERQQATLLEFGKGETSAMASTVGIPVAIGTLLLLAKKITSTGILRPIVPEVYEPALEILHAYGFNILEKID